MSANHLIIGLGGTGGKIIRSFRKMIYQEFRLADPDSVNIEYLYVDSSKEMMAQDDPTWRVLGKSVQLGQNSQLLITGADLKAILSTVKQYPNISGWIGDKAEWANILNSVVGETLGGQKRRLGRFLFANKASEFKTKLQGRVRALEDHGSAAVTFHVACGLAGGTGSGSIIDAVSIIRSAYPDPKTHPILVYALLPDRNPLPNWDTGNYHANGYAALVELNALSVGAYQPHNVASNDGARYSDLRDPFTGCYLFSNENERGRTINVNTEIPNIVASFLFQKIVTVRLVSWTALGKLENAENGDGTPETPGDRQRGERSKRFLTFGIKRLAIPEEEIGEYLTYKFAQQAAWQLQFNNWLDDKAFVDEPRNLDAREMVSNKDRHIRWLISDDHLRLSVGILPAEIRNPKWKPINQTWQDLVPQYKDLIREAHGNTPRIWLDELQKLFEKRFASEYRELGVKRFYETKEGDRKDHLREIRGRIERDLIDEWTNGVYSVMDVKRILDALLDSLGQRLTEMDQKIADSTRLEVEAANKVDFNNKEWAKIGIFAQWVGRRNQLFDAQATCLQELYIYRTNIAAWNFAKSLLKALINEISNLTSEVAACSATITQASKQFKEATDSRLNDEGKTDIQQQLVKFYEPQRVRNFVRELELDREGQMRQTQVVRNALLAEMGAQPTFAEFNRRVTQQRFLDLLEEKCAENAQQAHDLRVAEVKGTQRILGDSIIERLKLEYGGNVEAMEKYIHDLSEMAGCYVSFRAGEIARHGPGIPHNAEPAIRSSTVFLPDVSSEREFREAIKRAFDKSSSGLGALEFIPSSELPARLKPNEITLISVANLFPLRYLEQTHWLRDKYLARVNGRDGKRARIEVHSEGDGTQFPALIPPTADDVLNESLPYLLLGRATDVIQEVGKSGSKTRSLTILTKADSGLDNDPIPLGSNLLEAAEALDLGSAATLRSEVERRLASNYKNPEPRDDLRKRVIGLVEEVKALRGNDILDPQYRRFLDAARKGIELLSS